MAPVKKKKSVYLSIADKLKVIERLEAGCAARTVAQEYGLGLTTVKDLMKNKEKLRSFSQKYETGSNAVKIRKTMRLPPSEAIDEAVFKWYIQHQSSGVPVRGVEILAAAERFAKQLNVQKFTLNSGWLWRFRNRHGLPTIRSTVEEQNGGVKVEIDPFRQRLKEIIEQSSLSLAQLYNLDETGLLYRLLPGNTMASKHDDAVEQEKLSQERLSAMLCANASGSHRLKPVIVGKNRQPCELRKCLHPLPVHYYHNPTAWFTREIVQDWFFRHAEPEIRRFQMEDLKIPPDDVYALILLDKAPVHPDSHTLSSHDGRIRCLVIPPNISLTQPMEQGIILSTKRLYRRKFLDEVLVLSEEIADEDYDRHGARASANMKNYSLKAAIHNFADAWRDVTQSILTNSWKCLLNNNDVQWEMEGIKPADFLKALTTSGKTEVTKANVLTWLEIDEVDPGYQVLNEDEIVKEVLLSRGEGIPEDDTDEAMEGRNIIKLSTIRNCCDNILAYIDHSEDLAVQDYYEQFRNFRKTIILRQQRNASQMNVHNFFRPGSATSSPVSPGSISEEIVETFTDCT